MDHSLCEQSFHLRRSKFTSVDLLGDEDVGHLGNIVRHLGHLGTILGPFWAIWNHLGVFFYYLTFYDYLLYIYIYTYVNVAIWLKSLKLYI